MLTEKEESLLRNDLRNRTPLSSMNPVPVDNQMSIGQFLGNLVRTVSRLPILGGLSEPPTDGRPGRAVAAEDAELLAKTAHVRRKGERLIQLMARTGIGLDQLRKLSKVEIARFVSVAEQNEPREVAPSIFEPRPRPSKFYVEV